MRYRMRACECDAIKWTADQNQEDDPQWLVDAIQNKTVEFVNVGKPSVAMLIHQGDYIVRASVGDYIIRYDDGVLDTLDPESFNLLFEKI